jgi:hypothetical protein
MNIGYYTQLFKKQHPVRDSPLGKKANASSFPCKPLGLQPERCEKVASRWDARGVGSYLILPSYAILTDCRETKFR